MKTPNVINDAKSRFVILSPMLSNKISDSKYSWQEFVRLQSGSLENEHNEEFPSKETPISTSVQGDGISAK